MRVTAFVGVGALGFAVQLAVVAALTGLAGWPAAAATAVGVEAAVLHNFCWHRRWTWRDRTRGATITSQLLRFHLASGITSLGGNVLLSIVLTRGGLNAVLANVAAVGMMSAANYALADRWAFGPRPPGYLRPIGRTMTPAASRAPRNGAASAAAPGVSPCTQIVSTSSGTTVPSIAVTCRDRAICSARPTTVSRS